MLQIRAPLAALLLACAAPLAAPEAAIVAPGATLTAAFSFPAAPTHPAASILPPNSPDRVPDVLYGIVNAVQAGGFGAPTMRVELFDGTTQLGGYEFAFSTPFTVFSFVTAGSPYTFQATTASSFTSIVNGAINGSIRITNTSQVVPGFGFPAPSFDISVGSMQVGRAVGTNGFVPFDNGPIVGVQTVTSVVAVPEPMAAGLFGVALLGLLGVTRRQRAA
jgi:hypothetical protein